MSVPSEPDFWIHKHREGDFSDGECQCRKHNEIRAWQRTVFVPEHMQPIELIKSFSFNLPPPPFFAMQPSVNKFDVECIASAMMNPSLHWYTLYQFTFAPFEHYSAGGLEPVRIGDDYDPQDFVGAKVLISGHHRFLAMLLSGVPPTDQLKLQIREAPIATSLFPWSVVEWGR